LPFRTWVYPFSLFAYAHLLKPYFF